MNVSSEDEVYQKEILQLAEGLIKRKVPFEFKLLHGRFQIRTETWDAVCHKFSYGNNTGKLEIMGSIVEPFEFVKSTIDPRKIKDSVEGYLDAEEILRRVDLQLGI